MGKMFSLSRRRYCIREDISRNTDKLNHSIYKVQRSNIKLKPKKCALFEDEVVYLGHIVSEHGIKCDPEKLIAIKAWPTPENISDVRSFL